MGQSRRIDDDKNLEKADTQFSVQRVHCPEERSKAKEVTNYQYTSALMGERLKLFFAQLFLFISSVSAEQSKVSVRNTKICVAGQCDPLFVPTSLLMKTPTLLTDDPAQEDLLQQVPRTSGKAITTKSCY